MKTPKIVKDVVMADVNENGRLTCVCGAELPIDDGFCDTIICQVCDASWRNDFRLCWPHHGEDQWYLFTAGTRPANCVNRRQYGRVRIPMHLIEEKFDDELLSRIFSLFVVSHAEYHIADGMIAYDIASPHCDPVDRGAHPPGYRIEIIDNPETGKPDEVRLVRE